MEPKDQIEIKRILLENRTLLFNTRRSHEWKLFFGAMTLMLSIDFVFLKSTKDISSHFYLIWVILFIVIMVSEIIYENGLQKRNKIDRTVINYINDSLNKSLENDGFDYMPLIKQALDEENEKYHKASFFTFAQNNWAYQPKILVLGAVCITSILLPIFCGFH